MLQKRKGHHRIVYIGFLLLQVAICAGADSMFMWGAFITGLLAAIVYYLGAFLITKLKIDDPLDAVAGICAFSQDPIYRGIESV